MLEHARRLYEQRAYRELTELLQDEAELLRQPQLGFYLADARRRLGQTQPALELAQQLLPPARRAGIPRLQMDLLNLLGMLQFETGELARAEATWRELLDYASREGSADFVARANNNLGIVYTLHARPLEAITCYERAIAAYRELGLRRGIAQSCQNLAITYREIGRADDADEHFLSALTYARLDGSVDEVARAEQERALGIYLARRDAPLARVTAQRARRRFETLGDPIGHADCLRVLAMIELGEGNYEAVRDSVERALATAREAGHLLLEAELLEVQAGLADALGQAGPAATSRTRAAELFAQLRIPLWGSAFRERVRSLVSRTP